MKTALARFLLYYFRFFAKIQLFKIRPRIVGITGSAGKSSTMEAVAAVLQSKFSVKVGRKANSESGIPLDILGLQPHNYTHLDWLRLSLLAPLQILFNWKKYDFYVVEMGIDGPYPPKNMGYLLTILQPEIGVFTSVGAVHSETFDHLVTAAADQDRKKQLVTLIATEKARMLHALPQHGAAIINADYPEIVMATADTAAKQYYFGSTIGKYVPTVQVGSVRWTETGTEIHLHTTDEDLTVHIKNYLLPEHFGSSFAAAVCVGLHVGISGYRSCQALEQGLHIPAGRASILAGINGSTIVDSSYNSSSRPTLDFIEVFSQLTVAGRKIGLLGDMRELGTVSQYEHQQVVRAATEVFDILILVGPLMKAHTSSIISHTQHVKWFSDSWEAGKYLQTILQPGDWLLVKGSQNTILLEVAVEQLLADPSLADGLLARRGSFWDQQRKAIISRHSQNTNAAKTQDLKN